MGEVKYYLLCIILLFSSFSIFSFFGQAAHEYVQYLVIVVNYIKVSSHLMNGVLFSPLIFLNSLRILSF